METLSPKNSSFAIGLRASISRGFFFVCSQNKRAAWKAAKHLACMKNKSDPKIEAEKSKDNNRGDYQKRDSYIIFPLDFYTLLLQYMHPNQSSKCTNGKQKRSYITADDIRNVNCFKENRGKVHFCK